MSLRRFRNRTQKDQDFAEEIASTSPTKRTQI